MVRRSCSICTRCRFIGTSISATTSVPKSTRRPRFISRISMAKTFAACRSSSFVKKSGARRRPEQNDTFEVGGREFLYPVDEFRQFCFRGEHFESIPFLPPHQSPEAPPPPLLPPPNPPNPLSPPPPPPPKTPPPPPPPPPPQRPPALF